MSITPTMHILPAIHCALGYKVRRASAAFTGGLSRREPRGDRRVALVSVAHGFTRLRKKPRRLLEGDVHELSNAHRSRRNETFDLTHLLLQLARRHGITVDREENVIGASGDNIA
jgi:hypothetical protein